MALASSKLGAAFALAASGGSLAQAMLRMTVFALGAVTSLLAAGYGLGRLASRARILTGKTAEYGRIAFAALIALVGASVLIGLDHRIEAALIAVMPDWLAGFATQI